jgi:hypothetical protein
MHRNQIESDNAGNAAVHRKSGRAVFEPNGKTTWEWQTSTGVFELCIDEEQLRRLTPTDLAVVDHPAPRKFDGLWVHDSHRPAAGAPRKLSTDRKTATTRVGMWRSLWRLLAARRMSEARA